MTDTKFCKDCKYFCPRWQSSPSCVNAVTGLDVVYGTKEYRECSQERLDFYGRCGPEGKNFEPKQKLTLPSEDEKLMLVINGLKLFGNERI